jgi:uncharacterized protein YjbI with pentapeptide repeats
MRQVHNNLQGYRPPESRAELEVRYLAGERHFPGTDLSGADLSGIMLDGAAFERYSWFFDADFTGASLRGTSFRECNIKCVDFSNADLTDAIFELAAIEAICTANAMTSGLRLKGATSYGYTLTEKDELP